MSDPASLLYAPAAPGAQEAGARARTAQAAHRWIRERRMDAPRPFTVTGGYRDQVGDREPDRGGLEPSPVGGCIAVAPELLPARSRDAEIRWADGTVVHRTLLPPERAYGERSMPGRRDGGCDRGSTAVPTVTSVTAVTLEVDTTWGRATVPGWELAFADTTVRAVRIAVATDPSPRRAGVSGPAPDLVTVSADGRELTLRFAGAPDVPGRCGADYRVESTQRPDVVAVEVVARARAATPGAKDAACPLNEVARTVTTTLAAPLGDRPVIDTTATAIRR
ncbi:hypothetical protein ACIRL2_08625 [Embleya sp. NPDC127516]|uniref:hypothetical protein n=1 Tax=Embleya sp. NPDC127516 TaxID=3363990 RepID=UPI003816D5DE